MLILEQLREQVRLQLTLSSERQDEILFREAFVRIITSGSAYGEFAGKTRIISGFHVPR